MVSLAALCVVLPGRISFGEKELRWPTLAEVIGTEEAYPRPLPEEEGSITSPDTIAPTPDTLPSLRGRTEERLIIPKITVDSTTDSRLFLRAFYASLADAGTKKIRVVHYGDSQIEEDRMTQQIREALQAAYGGSGVGLVPLAQTIPSLTVRQELFLSGRFVSPQNGPKRYLVYGPKRDQRTDGLYGPMGQMAYMSDSLVKGSETVKAICQPLQPNMHYDRFRLLTGIIVDNIPMRGCMGIVFTKMDSTQLSTFYSEENVRLIIMQFGGNAIPSNKNPGTIQAIVKGLRQQVQYLRRCAPEASILFIGPSDMLTQIDGEWTTYPMVPYMDKLLRKMALEENIAYFSLYRWMGGSGSMMKWQEVGLAGSDGVHFTRAGARKAGKAVAEWMMEGNE